MYCNSCGKKNEDGAKFCVFCGSRLESAKKDMDPSQIAMSGTSGGLKKGRHFIFLVSLLLLAALIFFLWPKKIKYDFIGPYNQSGFAVARVKEKYGVCNTKEKEVLPAKYDKVVLKELNTESGLIPVLIDDGMEFLDTEGNRTFDEVIKSNINGYYIVRNGKKYGCVDSVGSYLTECSYKEVTLEEMCDDKIKAELDGCLNYISVYGGVLYDSVEDENTYGLSLAAKDNRYGYLDSNGKEIIPVQYNEVSIGERQENGKLPVELDGERNFLSEEGELLYTYVGEYGKNGLACACDLIGYYGYIDESGETVVDFWFDEAKDFGENNLARVKGEYWGYVNGLGTIVTDMIYDEASDFNEEGYALVKFGELYNFINEQGGETFEYVSPFYSSAAIAKQNGKYGLVDESGRLLTQTWYDMIFEEENYLAAGVARARLNGKYVLLGLDGAERSEYYDGILDGDVAVYNNYDEKGEFSSDMRETDTIPFWTEGRYGLISLQGDVIVSPEYIYISEESNNGFREAIFENEERGVIDKQGNAVVRGQYETLRVDFQNSILIIYTDKKCGAYSDKGEEIFPLEYEDIICRSNYLEIQKGEKCALADMEGNILTDFAYDAITDVKGDTFIASKDEKMGVSDMEGNLLIDYQYLDLKYCEDGKLGFVVASNAEGLWGCLDENGQETVPFRYDGFFERDNFIEASLNQKSGLLDKNLEWVVSAQYDDVKIMSNQYVLVEQNGMEGIFDISGNVVLPIGYDSIDYVEEGECGKIQIGDYSGVVNDRYEIIVPVEYEWISIYGENDNIFVTESSDATYSLFNKTGERLLSEAEWISSPGTGGVLNIQRDLDDGITEIYDIEGNYRKTLGYEVISKFENGLAEFRKDDYYGFINMRGEQIINCQYSDVEVFSEDGFTAVYNGEKWGYIDENGIPVTDFIYSSAEEFQYGYAAATLEEGMTGVISASGKTIIPFEYNYIGISDTDFYLQTDKQQSLATYAGTVVWTVTDVEIEE